MEPDPREQKEKPVASQNLVANPPRLPPIHRPHTRQCATLIVITPMARKMPADANLQTGGKCKGNTQSDANKIAPRFNAIADCWWDCRNSARQKLASPHGEC